MVIDAILVGLGYPDDRLHVPISVVCAGYEGGKTDQR
jgi:hypothetical protein